jgi:hypothetical protein
MAAPTTPVALYCAPDLTTFQRTAVDLDDSGVLLLEASTIFANTEVPFLVCGNLEEPTILFGTPLDQEHDEDDLQDLAQSIMDFHFSEVAKTKQPKQDGNTGCACPGGC